MLTNKVSKVGKVLVCGSKGVGKTAIIEQLIYGNITPDSNLHSTIEDTYISSVDTGRIGRELVRIFDIAGVQGNVQLPKHYLQIPDCFILVYDPIDPTSLDILAEIRNEIEKVKDKKEILIIVLANVRSKMADPWNADQCETVLNRGNNWCSREKMKHYIVDAMKRPTLYEPFIYLTSKLYAPQAKSSFPQLRQLTQKSSKIDS